MPPACRGLGQGLRVTRQPLGQRPPSRRSRFASQLFLKQTLGHAFNSSGSVRGSGSCGGTFESKKGKPPTKLPRKTGGLYFTGIDSVKLLSMLFASNSTGLSRVRSPAIRIAVRRMAIGLCLYLDYRPSAVRHSRASRMNPQSEIPPLGWARGHECLDTARHHELVEWPAERMKPNALRRCRESAS